MTYKAEVIADSSGKWTGNQLRFATPKEAEVYVNDLMQRWTLVREVRVVHCADTVNCRVEYVGDRQFKLVHLDIPE